MFIIKKYTVLQCCSALTGVFTFYFLALGALNKKKTNFKEGKAEAKGRDANDENKKGTSRAMKMMYQMDGRFNFA